MISLELLAVVVTLGAVYLTTRQKIWCWPLGMISVVLYASVFYQARLYADMGLQALYFALAIYGWWAWPKICCQCVSWPIAIVSNHLLQLP